jgi:transcriptional regulator with PAS, ATPase and Fis domain
MGKLRSALALLLLDMGERHEAARLFESLVSAKDKVPELVARIAQLSKRLLSEQSNSRLTNVVGRPARIAEALGNRYLLDSVPLEAGAVTSVTPALDDAAALVELAGYPHVLAREAYALLEGAGVTERLALVARGAAEVRVLATAHWDEAGARRAAADVQDRLQIVCGVHREEAWEVIAELTPALADRCTAIAVRQLVDTAVTLDRYRREEKQRTALWPADTFETDGGLFISEQMSDLLSSARRVASSNLTVLLTGETGTGKEVLARAIHRASPRAGKPFVPFNCTAVARDMLESQLFGYRRGAFTGAEHAFDGVIRAAAGGTLFLDEIGEIGPELQPKLLRFLETCEVHGLGEPQPVKVDIRVIAATNGDLEAMVADGRLREDLFYRLNAVWLKLPPLRERREEIPPLIDHYLRKAAEEQKKGRLTLADETLEYLLLYAWPGNVRQLVNEIRRIAAFAEPDSVITPALLSPDIQASRRTIRVTEGDSPEIRVRLDQPMGDALEAIEQAMVRRALDRAHGNFENAARLLGISRKGLFLKRRRWGMQRAS